MSGHFCLVLNLLIWSLTLLMCFLLQHVLVNCRWFYIPSSAFVVGFCFLSGWLLSALIKPVDEWTVHDSRMAIADVFYFLMLPIIIFNAGYHLTMKTFKRNLDGILSIALFGTWLNIGLLSTLLFSAMQFVPYVREQLISLNYMECIAFSAILSSTDPVSTLSIFSSLRINEDLFYLVLGESLLNDAVAISIFNASSYLIQRLVIQADPLNAVSMYLYYFSTWLLQLLVVFILSGLLGYVLCLVVAGVCKNFSFDHDHISPLICCILVGYIAFYLAEALHLSGVIACFAASVNIRRFFIVLSLDKVAADNVSYCIECFGYSAETASMAILGFAMVLVKLPDFKLYLVLALLVASLAVRFLSSFILLSIVNLSRYLYHRQWSDSYEKVASPGRLCEPEGNVLEHAEAHSDTKGVVLLPAKHLTMVWMSGLRGALNLALAIYFPSANENQDAIYTNTLFFVIGTILLFGAATTPLIHCLNINMNDTATNRGDDERSSHSSDCLTTWERKFIICPLLERQVREIPVVSHSRKESERCHEVHSACCLGLD